MPVVTGLDAAGGVGGAITLLFKIETVHLPSLAVAALTVGLAVILSYSRISSLGRLIAVIFPSLVVLLLDWDKVRLVRDSGVIPQGIPLSRFPPLAAFTPEVVTGAAAVAVIILVQSAGVSQCSQPRWLGPQPIARLRGNRSSQCGFGPGPRLAGGRIA